MFEVIQTPEEIESLANEWNDLAEPFKTPLLQNEWFTACSKALYRPGQLHVVIIRQSNGITAIAPLVTIRNRLVKRLELLGSSILGEPSGLIYKDRESLHELISGIIRKGYPLILSRLPARSSVAFHLQDNNRMFYSVLVRKGTGTPFLPINTSWSEFEKSMSSRRRYDLRRALKRAESFGNVRFQVTIPDHKNISSYFEDLVRVEAAGWKGRAGTALQCDERLRKFFFIYSQALCRSGSLRLCFLHLDHQPVAALLGVQYFNRFWVLKIGYDESFSRCSPGILLIHETIRFAFEEGLEGYEFLGSDEPWIRMWTDQKHPHVTLKVYPFSILGKYSLCVDSAAFIMKNFMRRGN